MSSCVESVAATGSFEGLFGGIGQCRAARRFQGLGVMARGHEHGHYCQAAWHDLCLHSVIKLLGGRVCISGAAAAER